MGHSGFMSELDKLISEIVVLGYSRRFVAAVKQLLKIEGGFVNDPIDRGGATKYGISLRYLVTAGKLDDDCDGWADFDLDMDGDIDAADVRQLTVHQAVYLYHRDFWQTLRCEEFAAPLGEALFDQAVNGGATAAKKLLQRAINLCYRKFPPNGAALLNDDGVLGDFTMANYKAVLQLPALGMPALISAYRDVAADRYREIVRRNPSQKRFLKGWLNRAHDLGRGV